MLVQDLHCTVEWGRIGFRNTWRRVPTSILQRLLLAWRPGQLQPGGGGSAISQRRRWRLDDSVDEDEVLEAQFRRTKFSQVGMAYLQRNQQSSSFAAAAAAPQLRTAQQPESAAAMAAAEAGRPSGSAAAAQRDLLAADALEAEAPQLRAANPAIRDAGSGDGEQCHDSLEPQTRVNGVPSGAVGSGMSLAASGRNAALLQGARHNGSTPSGEHAQLQEPALSQAAGSSSSPGRSETRSDGECALPSADAALSSADAARSNDEQHRHRRHGSGSSRSGGGAREDTLGGRNAHRVQLQQRHFWAPSPTQEAACCTASYDQQHWAASDRQQ